MLGLLSAYRRNFTQLKVHAFLLYRFLAQFGIITYIMMLNCTPSTQNEYYATHQYFLSKRSLYLVMWKMTDGEKGIAEMEQWLINIQA